MGLPVTVYKSTDVGSPQVASGKPSEILNVLQKCLVDGYGSKASLGWLLLDRDDSLNRIAFKNDVSKGASGNCFIVKSYNGTDANNNSLWLQSAKSFISLDSLDGLGYMNTMTPPPSTTVWTLIGTEHAFILLVGKATSKMGGWVQFNESGFFAGDYTPLVSSDAGRFILFSDRLTALSSTTTGKTSQAWPNYFGNLTYSQSQVDCLQIYDADNINNPNSYTIMIDNSISISSVTEEATTSPTMDVYSPLIIRLFAKSVHSAGSDRVGSPWKLSEISPVMRGIVPGIINRYFGRNGNDDYPYPEVTINGQQHMMLRCGGGGCNSFINLEEW
ncbi:hypothetical protein [Shewanella sp. MEBiC00475]|uniref:hypothetical protein n=1 Tax=Shewanella sp. MEBiC00475 TaxID=2575361 RepID=UPI0010C138FE|nr:hypothetical protein [Shewanella sp. MEBiC00475]